jgi:hypothetical protein
MFAWPLESGQVIALQRNDALGHFRKSMLLFKSVWIKTGRPQWLLAEIDQSPNQIRPLRNFGRLSAFLRRWALGARPSVRVRADPDFRSPARGHGVWRLKKGLLWIATGSAPVPLWALGSDHARAARKLRPSFFAANRCGLPRFREQSGKNRLFRRTLGRTGGCSLPRLEKAKPVERVISTQHDIEAGWGAIGCVSHFGVAAARDWQATHHRASNLRLTCIGMARGVGDVMVTMVLRCGTGWQRNERARDGYSV